MTQATAMATAMLSRSRMPRQSCRYTMKHRHELQAMVVVLALWLTRHQNIRDSSHMYDVQVDLVLTVYIPTSFITVICVVLYLVRIASLIAMHRLLIVIATSTA